MTKRLIVLALCALAVVAAGCGSSNKSSSSSSKTPTAPPAGAKKGGTLTVVNLSDVDSLDPAYWYYQTDEAILLEPTQRQLYAFGDNDTGVPSPDLATGPVQVSDGGKTLTIHIKKGIKYSPPYNKEVTSADFAYALNRCFNPKFSNGYAGAYFTDIVGESDVASGKAKTASGVTTPDPQTLVIKLSKPNPVLPQALGLPCSAPVPEAYAAKYDAAKTPTYGQHLLATGPYMIQNDASGKITGYSPGHQIVMVRNPNWDPKTDWRPAYLDKIIINEGNDPNVGNRKVLSGQSMVANPVDLAPTPEFLKQNLSGPNKDQLVPSPYTGRTRWVALNTTKKPFNNINVRKAVAAAINRQAMLLAFGGTAVGKVANHIIPPGVAGFEEAGGLNGTGVDFLKNPGGDPQLAASYLKKAGFSNGKYSGPAITMVADEAGNQKAAAQVVLNGLQSIGFKVNFRTAPRDTMFSKFCSVPKNEPEVCPSVGWLKDFADPQTMLDPVFNGKNIVPTGNVNWELLNDKTLNKEMDAAETIVGDQARATAWAKIDKDITATASAIPWMWDKPYLVRSANVVPVLNQANAAWDLSSMSLK